MKSPRSSEISFRAIGLGLILIPINCYWLVISRQPYQYQAIPTIISPFFNVIFIIVVLLLLNQLLKTITPRSALSQAELITVYIMLSVTSAIQSFQMMQTLVPVMEHAFTFATPENDWKNLFFHYIPTWLSVSDETVLRPYYDGESTLYIQQHLLRWLGPCLWWSCFVVVLVAVMASITVMFRKPWVEDEKLAYPTIQLPLEITDVTTSIFRNRWLWVGVVISGSVALINGFASLFPTVPTMKIHPYDHNLGRYFTTVPWNAMGRIPIGVILPVVGIAFFMPLDMSLSCIVFYAFWKLQRVVMLTLGFQRIAYTSYVGILTQQAFGALIGIAVIAAWACRKHLFGMFRGDASDDRSTGRVTRPLQRIGLFMLLGMAFLVFFLRQAGMAIWLSITFFGLYYIVSLGLTRIRAEMGVPLHDFHFTGPDQMLPDILPTRRIGVQNLTVMSMLGFFNFTYRAHPQPHQIEGLALLHRAGVNVGAGSPRPYRFISAIVAALIVGTVALFWSYLHIGYRSGGSSLQRFARVIYVRLANWLTYPTDAVDVSGVIAVAAGFGIVLLLTLMRTRFLWWKLHPAGFAISNSRDINYLWFSILISLLAKWMLVRLGGVRTYQQARPFFLGLILGDYVVGSIWTIVGTLVHQRIFFGGMT